MDNLMDGSTEIDHKKHTGDFTSRAKRIVTKANLEEQCKTYQAKWGYFSERKFVGIFRKKDSVTVVWKQTVTKIPDEFIAILKLVQRGSRYLVDSAWVF
jgi:hypothetical protein